MKKEIKKELEDSVINDERHEDKELEEKASRVKKREDGGGSNSRIWGNHQKQEKKYRLVSMPTRKSFRKFQGKCIVYWDGKTVWSE